MPKLLYSIEALENELAELGKLGRPFHAKDEGLVVYSSELHTSLSVYSSRESVGYIGSVDEISRFLASLGCFASLSELYFKYYPAESKGWPEIVHYQTLMQTLDLQQLGWYCLLWLRNKYDLQYNETCLKEQAVFEFLKQFDKKIMFKSIHEASLTTFYMSNLLTACGVASARGEAKLESLSTKFGEEYCAYSFLKARRWSNDSPVFLHEEVSYRLTRQWDNDEFEYFTDVAACPTESVYLYKVLNKWSFS